MMTSTSQQRKSVHSSSAPPAALAGPAPPAVITGNAKPPRPAGQPLVRAVSGEKIVKKVGRGEVIVVGVYDSADDAYFTSSRYRYCSNAPAYVPTRTSQAQALSLNKLT